MFYLEVAFINQLWYPKNTKDPGVSFLQSYLTSGCAIPCGWFTISVYLWTVISWTRQEQMVYSSYLFWNSESFLMVAKLIDLELVVLWNFGISKLNFSFKNMSFEKLRFTKINTNKSSWFCPKWIQKGAFS